MKEEIKKFFKGEVEESEETLQKYSHDASLFEVRPKLVVFPQDEDDLKELVKFVSEKKKTDPSISITMRAAGSDMTGGPLNESIIADTTRHMNYIGEVSLEKTTVEPGVFYRDFEPKTLEKGLILPCYTASKNLCALGGMMSNNCAGEKTLRYGQMRNFVNELGVIFSDGNKYQLRKLNKKELEIKKNQDDFEGEVYRKTFDLIDKNYNLIKLAKPRVSKNSSGYALWDVYDADKETFDLTQLIVGAQGTLGLITDANLRLVKEKTHHDMIALFFKSWDELPQVVNAILPHDPESLETFDEETLKLGIHFMPEIAKRAGSNFISFALKFFPELLVGLRMMGLPKLIILVEVAESSEEEVKEKVGKIVESLKGFNLWYRVIEKDTEEAKFWTMRRESFNLLRQHVKGKRTAPFVEDFCIPADKVPEFLPQALKILKTSGIEANIAGHAGNGNFHIIPLMDLTQAGERAKITKVADKFYDLVARYKGTLSGEHNDGIIRTPYLGKMYTPEVLDLFKKVKELFDPLNIFNPGKKVPLSSPDLGTIEFIESHISVK
jgi:FAD/FMN-containing dehydrogenase